MQISSKRALGFLALATTTPAFASAHCPLCTTAVGGAVIGAAALGMPVGVIAIFAGALIASTGLWMAAALKRRSDAQWAQSPWTGHALVLAALASLLIPLRLTPAVAAAATSAELIVWGSNQWMIMIDWLIVGSLVGAATMYLGGWLSAKIKEAYGKVFIPFQGIVLTIALLTAEAGLLLVIR